MNFKVGLKLKKRQKKLVTVLKSRCNIKFSLHNLNFHSQESKYSAPVKNTQGTSGKRSAIHLHNLHEFIKRHMNTYRNMDEL